MSDDDLWRHHAYVYAFRRILLDSFDKVSPLDPDGVWFNQGMVATATRFYRRKFGGIDPVSKSDQRDWRKIRARDLTAEEHEIADPAVSALAVEARRNIAKAEEKWKSAFMRAGQEQPHGGRDQRHVPPPVPLPEADDPRVQEALRRMGEQPEAW